MNRMITIGVVVTAAVLLSVCHVPAVTYELIVENDQFGSRTDRYYTHAAEIAGWWNDSEEFGRRIAIGQQIYTPQDISIAEPQPNDRPWGSALYLRYSCNWWESDRDRTIEAALGVVGTLASGDSFQTTFHKWIGADEPKGWDNQLKSEPYLNLRWVEYLRKPLFQAADVGLNLYPYYGAVGGLQHVYANAGGVISLVWPASERHRSTIIKPSQVSAYGESETKSGLTDFGIELFAAGEGKVVGYNTFVQGSWLRSGPGVGSEALERLVNEYQLGVALRWWRMSAGYTYVSRGEEFEQQEGRAKFGSIRVSLLWRI